MARASGLSSITVLIVGPCLSISSIRARYFSVIERALNFPEAIPVCRSAMVISSNSNGFIARVRGRRRKRPEPPPLPATLPRQRRLERWLAGNAAAQGTHNR